MLLISDPSSRTAWFHPAPKPIPGLQFFLPGLKKPLFFTWPTEGPHRSTDGFLTLPRPALAWRFVGCDQSAASHPVAPPMPMNSASSYVGRDKSLWSPENHLLGTGFL